MRRRGPGGIGAVNKQRLAQAKYAEKGTEIQEVQLSQMGKLLESFKNYLEDFAAKHKADIKKNPEFRGHFQQMCARIGVDPLASSKGFWSELLGVGDFYYELGVQIVEICMATRNRNGGLIALDELQKLITKTNKARQDVTEDDLARAIKKIHALGNGFQVIPVGNRRLVQSVPGELSMDHTTALQLAQGTGYTSVSTMTKELSWDKERTSHVLNLQVFAFVAGLFTLPRADPRGWNRIICYMKVWLGWTIRDRKDYFGFQAFFPTVDQIEATILR